MASTPSHHGFGAWRVPLSPDTGFSFRTAELSRANTAECGPDPTPWTAPILTRRAGEPHHRPQRGVHLALQRRCDPTLVTDRARTLHARSRTTRSISAQRACRSQPIYAMPLIWASRRAISASNCPGRSPSSGAAPWTAPIEDLYPTALHARSGAASMACTNRNLHSVRYQTSRNDYWTIAVRHSGM
jgi:hypothetical protein